MKNIACIGLLFFATSLTAQDIAGYPVPKDLGPVETYGQNIQRTMRLLATSTADKKNTVRILFYGQSITEQDWWKAVVEDLRKRFPHANLIAENRAIGGFSSQILVKTAETDLYPFYPDLVIFHVYGSHIEYENIIRNIRERTTAEILMQTDHVTRPEDLSEETNPEKLTPKNWSPWMNHAFLPSMAKKYQCELVNQHELWKQYLRETKLAPSRLLKDSVHLNDRGCFLMAEIVKAYLRYDPKLVSPHQDLVQTFYVGEDLIEKEGALELPFSGNKVDVIFKSEPKKKISVLDGKKPNAIPGLVARTRTTSYPNSSWPCLLKSSSEIDPIVEDWTLTITEVSEGLKKFRFEVEGSITGKDGAGHSGEKFISKSGRVVIDPQDWNFEYALRVFKKPILAPFVIKWKVLPQAVDELSSPSEKDLAVEKLVTIAQGLPNEKHTIRLAGEGISAIQAIRVYRPALLPVAK